MGVIGFLRGRAVCGAALGLMSLAMLVTSPQASARGDGVSFQPFYEYKIVFDGKGTYTRTVSDEGGGLLKEEASWSWNTVYPVVLIPTTASSPLAGLLR